MWKIKNVMIVVMIFINDPNLLWNFISHLILNDHDDHYACIWMLFITFSLFMLILMFVVQDNIIYQNIIQHLVVLLFNV